MKEEDKLSFYFVMFDRFKIVSFISIFAIGFITITAYLFDYNIAVSYDLVNIPLYGFFAFVFLLGFIVFLFGPWCVYQTRESTVCYVNGLVDAWFRHVVCLLFPFAVSAVLIWCGLYNFYYLAGIILIVGVASGVGVSYLYRWEFSHEFFANFLKVLFSFCMVSALSFLFFAFYFLFLIEIFEPANYSKRLGGDGWYYLAACVGYVVLSSLPLVISRGRRFVLAVCFVAGVTFWLVMSVASAEFGRFALRTMRVGGGVVKEVMVNKEDLTKLPLRMQDYFCGLKDCSVTVPRKVCLWFVDGAYYYVSKGSDVRGQFCPRLNGRSYPLRKDLVVLQ